VIEAWDGTAAMNEGFRHSHHDDSDLQKAAEDSFRSNLDRAEKHPDYEHPTYAGIHRDVPEARPGSSPRRCPTICRAR